LHQVGDLFELNVKLRCQKVKYAFHTEKHSRFATSEQGYTNILLEHHCECWDLHLGVPKVQEQRNGRTLLSSDKTT